MPACRPIGPGGTRRPTPTRPSTATSSATRTSCGAPRACVSRTPSCSAPAETLAGRTILEIGCGAAQCGRWLTAQGAQVVALDLSAGQLRHARELDRRLGDPDRRARPGGRHSATAGRRERRHGLLGVRRGALRHRQRGACTGKWRGCCGPAADWIFSVTHPMRWCFLDDPGPGGLTVERSYFDRRSYVETGEDGAAGVRRTAPHDGRPHPGDRRRRSGAARRGGARVAARTTTANGASGVPCAAGCSRGRPSTSAASPPEASASAGSAAGQG